MDLNNFDLALLNDIRLIRWHNQGHSIDQTYNNDLQRNLKYLLRVNSTRHAPGYDPTTTTLCGVVFHVNFIPSSWIMINCNDVLMPNYFLCENEWNLSKPIRSYLFKKAPFYCGQKFTYVAGYCFNAVFKYYVDVYRRHVLFNYTSIISSYLTAWSFGNSMRTDIAVSLDQNGLGCLASDGFKYQRLKTWIHVYYSPNRYILHTLVQRNVRLHKQTCNSNRYYTCSKSTCILTSYVCDRITDCHNGLDETSCAQICDVEQDCQGQCSNGNLTCSMLFYHCSSGEYAALTNVCDWKAQCTDNSDESVCNTETDIIMSSASSSDLLHISTSIVEVKWGVIRIKINRVHAFNIAINN